MTVSNICCLMIICHLSVSKTLIALKKEKHVGQSVERVEKPTTGATLQTVGTTVHLMVRKDTLVISCASYEDERLYIFFFAQIRSYSFAQRDTTSA